MYNVLFVYYIVILFNIYIYRYVGPSDGEVPGGKEEMIQNTHSLGNFRIEQQAPRRPSSC